MYKLIYRQVKKHKSPQSDRTFTCHLLILLLPISCVERGGGLICGETWWITSHNIAVETHSLTDDSSLIS